MVEVSEKFILLRRLPEERLCAKDLCPLAAFDNSISLVLLKIFAERFCALWLLVGIGLCVKELLEKLVEIEYYYDFILIDRD